MIKKFPSHLYNCAMHYMETLGYTYGKDYRVIPGGQLGDFYIYFFNIEAYLQLHNRLKSQL